MKILLRPSEQLRIFLIVMLVGLATIPMGGVLLAVLLMGGVCAVLSIGMRNFWIGVIAVGFLAAGWSGWRSENLIRTDGLRSLVGQDVEMRGEVVTSPDVRERSVRVTVRSDFGKFLLILPSDVEVEYGDQVWVQGGVELPTNPPDFDYRAWLGQRGIRVIVRNPDVFERAPGGGAWLVRMAQRGRSWAEQNIRNVLPEPHATVAVGVLLGVRNALPEWAAEDFQRSGLQHLLVVSGSNVAIVLVLVGWMLAPIGRRAVLLGALLSLVWFVAMTGADPPVLRAAVMGGAVGIAAALGRFSDGRTMVLLAAAVLGAWQPGMLRDAGYQLSVAATLGIILFAPIFLRFFHKFCTEGLAKILGVLIVISLAAQVAVLPVLGVTFGTFPVAGIGANLFAEPLVPLAMAGGTLVALLGGIPGGIVLAIPGWLAIEAMLWVAKLFSMLPVLEISHGVALFLCVIWTVVGIWLVLDRRWERWSSIDTGADSSHTPG